MYKLYLGSKVTEKLYHLILGTNIICIALIFFGEGLDHIYASIIFILMLISFGFYFARKNNPIAHITIFQATISQTIPITLTSLIEYNFSSQIEMPYDNSEYFLDLKYSILYLTFLYIFLFLGLIIGNKKNITSIKSNYINHIDFKKILFIIPFFFITEIYSITKSMENFINRFDASYIYQKVDLLSAIFNPLSLIFVCVCGIDQGKKNSNQHLLIYLLILFYLITNTITGSRAALISVFLYFYLIPSFVYPNIKYKIPFKIGLFETSIVFIIIYSFFHVNNYLRSHNLNITDVRDFNTIYEIYKSYNLIPDYFFSSLNRLSASFNSYCVIFNKFGHYFHEFNYDFLIYNVKSLANLLLPGTVYKEAYLPTSIIFSDVISGHELLGPENQNIWSVTNTQNYGLFGVLLIAAGSIPSLILVYSISYLFSRALSGTENILNRYLIVFSYSLIFASSGLDSAIQTIILTVIPIKLMLVFFLNTSQRNTKS